MIFLFMDVVILVFDKFVVIDVEYMSIYLANLEFVYWPVRSSCRRGGNGVKG